MTSFEPTKPEDAHKKDSVSVSVRTIGKGLEEHELEIEDRKRGSKLQPINTSLGKGTEAMILFPKPSSDPSDPLVCANPYHPR